MYVLIGDSGYNSKQTFLCTPFSLRDKPNEEDWSPAEKDYHRSLIQTRNTIERAFGLLKRRFPVCAFGMRLRRLDVAQKVITICFMFHNICLDMGDAGIEPDPAIEGLIQTIDDELFDQQPIPEHIYRPPSPRTRRRRANVRAAEDDPPLSARERIVLVFAQRVLNGIRVPDGAERNERRSIQNRARAVGRRGRAQVRLGLRRQRHEMERELQ